MSTIHAQLESAIGQSINEDRTVTVDVGSLSFDAATSALEEVTADDDGEIDYRDTRDNNDAPIREVWNTGSLGWKLSLSH